MGRNHKPTEPCPDCGGDCLATHAENLKVGMVMPEAIIVVALYDADGELMAHHEFDVERAEACGKALIEAAEQSRLLHGGAPATRMH